MRSAKLYNREAPLSPVFEAIERHRSYVPWIRLVRFFALFGCVYIVTRQGVHSLSRELSSPQSQDYYEDLQNAMFPNRPMTTVAISSVPTLSTMQQASLQQYAIDNQKHIARIYLLGERNSGTNMLNEALWRAFPTYGKGVQKFQSDIPAPLVHKHMVRANARFLRYPVCR